MNGKPDVVEAGDESLCCIPHRRGDGGGLSRGEAGGGGGCDESVDERFHDKTGVGMGIRGLLVRGFEVRYLEVE